MKVDVHDGVFSTTRYAIVVAPIIRSTISILASDDPDANDEREFTSLMDSGMSGGGGMGEDERSPRR